jgi:hypothetical protein
MLLMGDSDCCCAHKDTALPDGETPWPWRTNGVQNIRSTLQWLGLICCANMYRVRSSSTELLPCCQIYPFDPLEQYSSGKLLYIFLWKHLVKIDNAVVISCPYLSFTCTLLGYNTSMSVIAISHNTAKRCRAQGERPNVFLRDHACSSPAE